MVTQCQPPVSTGLQAHTGERDVGHPRSSPGDAGKTTAEQQCEIAATGRLPVAGEQSNSKTASTPPLAVLPKLTNHLAEADCHWRMPFASSKAYIL
jgi:hypothetical protein